MHLHVGESSKRQEACHLCGRGRGSLPPALQRDLPLACEMLCRPSSMLTLTLQE